MPNLPRSRRDCRYRLFSYQNTTVSTFYSGEKTITGFGLNFGQSNRRISEKAYPNYKRLSKIVGKAVIKIVTLFWNSDTSVTVTGQLQLLE